MAPEPKTLDEKITLDPSKGSFHMIQYTSVNRTQLWVAHIVVSASFSGVQPFFPDKKHCLNSYLHTCGSSPHQSTMAYPFDYSDDIGDTGIDDPETKDSSSPDFTMYSIETEVDEYDVFDEVDAEDYPYEE